MTEDPKNAQSGKIFGVKVVYLNNNNDRLRYTYQKRQGEANPEINIERSTKLFSSFFFWPFAGENNDYLKGKLWGATEF